MKIGTESVQKKSGRNRQSNILFVMDDSAIATGVGGILSRNRDLQLRVYDPGEINLVEQTELENVKVLILNMTDDSRMSLKYLGELFQNPNVMEVLMVDIENNSVQVFQKRNVRLANFMQFENLFSDNT